MNASDICCEHGQLKRQCLICETQDAYRELYEAVSWMFEVIDSMKTWAYLHWLDGRISEVAFDELRNSIINSQDEVKKLLRNSI